MSEREARRAGEVDGYSINLILYATAYFIGVLFWLKLDASKPIVPDSGPAATASGPGVEEGL